MRQFLDSLLENLFLNLPQIFFMLILLVIGILCMVIAYKLWQQGRIPEEPDDYRRDEK